MFAELFITLSVKKIINMRCFPACGFILHYLYSFCQTKTLQPPAGVIKKIYVYLSNDGHSIQNPTKKDAANLFNIQKIIIFILYPSYSEFYSAILLQKFLVRSSEIFARGKYNIKPIDNKSNQLQS